MNKTVKEKFLNLLRKEGILLLMFLGVLAISAGCGNNNAANQPAPGYGYNGYGGYGGPQSCGGASGAPISSNPGPITAQLFSAYSSPVGSISLNLGAVTPSYSSQINVVGNAQIQPQNSQYPQPPFCVTSSSPGVYSVPQQGSSQGYLQYLTMTGSMQVPIYGGYSAQPQQVTVIIIAAIIDTQTNRLNGQLQINGLTYYAQ